MADVSETDYQTILNQTVARITEITLNPKPTYSVDGQSFEWAEYLAALQRTIEWAKKMLAQESASRDYEEFEELVP